MDTPTARVIRRDASTLATVLDHPYAWRCWWNPYEACSVLGICGGAFCWGSSWLECRRGAAWAVMGGRRRRNSTTFLTPDPGGIGAAGKVCDVRLSRYLAKNHVVG